MVNRGRRNALCMRAAVIPMRLIENAVGQEEGERRARGVGIALGFTFLLLFIGPPEVIGVWG